MQTKADISIVIVNWRVRHLVEKCLQSIQSQSQGLKVEIIIVDNDSHDGLAEMLMMDWPEVKYIGLIKNVGFAKANNLGLEQATGNYVCLLNPDTELKPGFLAGVMAYFASHPQVDIIGPRLLNPDGSLQASVRRLPKIKSQILTLLKLQNIANPKVNLEKFLPKSWWWLGKILRSLFKDNQILSDYLAEEFDYHQEQPVEQLMGAAIICRAEAIAKIGKLDEGFYIWFEEVDFLKRAKSLGLSIHYVPSLEVVHYGGQSFAKSPSLKKQWIFDRSLLYYFWKHEAKWQSLIIILLLPLNLFLTIIYALVFPRKK